MKKEGLWVVFSFALLAVFTTYSNCGLHLTPDTKTNISGSTTQNADASLTETFNQPDDKTQVMIPEVVFVLDTSGSMAPKVTQIKSAIEGWITQLQSKGVEKICLGTMRGNSNATDMGLLTSAAGNDKCYCTFGSGAVDAATAATKLGENLDAVLSSAAGGGLEETMIRSMHEALNDPAKLAANQADGCFRSDTSLAVVLVSDENDISAASDGTYSFDQSKHLQSGQNFSDTRGDALYNPVTLDEQNARRNFYCKDNAGNYVTNADGDYVNQIDHETLAQDIRDFNNSYTSFGTAIGFYANNLPAPSVYSQPFWGGLEFAQTFDTNMVDLKDAMDGNFGDFQDAMNAMGDDLALGMQYFYMFDLGEAICDTDVDGDYIDENIVITAGGQNVDLNQISVSPNGKKITFEQTYTFSPGDEVKITYAPCAP